MIDNTIIKQIVFRIASIIQPEKIYLFGSYATGQANEDSDIDLLIIKETEEERYKRSLEIQKLLIGTKLPADIVVYTKAEFEAEKQNPYSFINSAIQDAQLLYER